ncbi:MAG: SufB/SufD family protein [Eggerthellaceae bacterium]|jgi:Fe-S cluster assembly protein SufD
MEATTLAKLNLMPDITWHFLRMNHTEAQLPEVQRAPAGAIDVDAAQNGAVTVITAQADNGAFDAALAGYDKAVEQWETANGPEAAAWLTQACTRQVVLEVPKGAIAEDLTVRLDAAGGCATVAQVDVIAHENARATVNVTVDSPNPGTGVVGVFLRVLAEENARVQVRVQQTLDATWQYLENLSFYEAADARVKLTQIELGAAESYVGAAVNLAGDRSDVDIDTRYLGNGRRTLDFNHVIRQRGLSTTSEFIANGVLTDESQKTLRGTIDLIHGCKGSVGDERETVLLSDDRVRNKTVPIILCDEDDVQGNHGATIGHVNEDHLHYLESRGLDEEQAQALFAQALFDHAADEAADEDAVRAIDRLAVTVLGHPTGEWSEEGGR